MASTSSPSQEQPSQEEKEDAQNDGLGTTVASHYNKLQETGIEARKESRIYYMRGFNNWVKSTLINDFIEKIRRKFGNGNPVNVIDLGSGKGGDQRKWKIARVNRVIHADIAGTSVEQSEERYKEMKRKEHPRYPTFEAEFYTLDCTKERLKDKLKDPTLKYDISSCQFAFHYSFESLEQADMMLKNACESLKPGGYFIGTTPDARELMRRLRASDSNSFGNDVYRITFDSKTEFPLFGCKYDFHLEGVVDCPEFLVHFGMLEKLAEKYGMVPVYKENFASLFEQRIKDKRNVDLLRRMNALEEYPAPKGKQLVASSSESYSEAKKRVEELEDAATDGEDNPRPQRVLTISRDEWEAITVYLAFAFQKLSTPLPDADTDIASESKKLAEDAHIDSVNSAGCKRKHSDTDDGNEDGPSPRKVPPVIT